LKFKVPSGLTKILLQALSIAMCFNSQLSR